MTGYTTGRGDPAIVPERSGPTLLPREPDTGIVFEVRESHLNPIAVQADRGRVDCVGRKCDSVRLCPVTGPAHAKRDPFRPSHLIRGRIQVIVDEIYKKGAAIGGPGQEQPDGDREIRGLNHGGRSGGVLQRRAEERATVMLKIVL